MSIISPSSTSRAIMHVLISGAGIAGPAFAWFIQKTGARVTILEKVQQLSSSGQNVDMSGAAVTAMKKMGLIDEVLRHSTKEQGTRLIDSRGQPFAPFPITEGHIASPTSKYEILRGDLAMIFHKATKDLPGVDYKFGTTISEVLTNDEKAVKVLLSNGEIHEYDLLVAADGQWSTLRKQCFPPESIKVVDTNMYAVYWSVPCIPGDDDWWNIYIALRSRLISLRPHLHGTVGATLTCMPLNNVQKQTWQQASRGDRKTQHELLRSEFADAGWQTQRLLDAMEGQPDFYFQALQQIKMDKWSTGRIICLGDTAFAPTPLCGAGSSLAITGAYMLAGELSELREGEHPRKAFEAYEAQYHPFIEKMQQIPPGFPGMVHPVSVWKRCLLQSAASALSWVLRTPWIAKRISSGMQDNEDNDDGFPLPTYPTLDEAIAKSSRAEGSLQA